LGTGASSIKPKGPAVSQQQQAFNALLLKDPRFGLTIEELDEALKADLALASRSGPALTFSITFLPSDEVLIRATPNLTAAAIATSLAPTPAAVESTLLSLKTTVARTVSRLGLAGAVSLCHVDASQVITRREGDAAANNGGWSAVASRGSWRRGLNNKAPAAATEQRAPSAFVALRKLEARKKAVAAVDEEKVEEDWLAAVEKEEREGSEKSEEAGSGSGSGGEEVAADGADGVVHEEKEVERPESRQEDGEVDSVAVAPEVAVGV
jgi:transcriptional repressor NF-X1